MGSGNQIRIGKYEYWVEVSADARLVFINNGTWVGLFSELGAEWGHAVHDHPELWEKRVDTHTGEIRESQETEEALKAWDLGEEGSTPTEKLRRLVTDTRSVAFEVARHANYRDGKDVYPAFAHIMDRTCLGEDRVRTIMHVLEHHGWIKTTFSARRERANEYRCSISAEQIIRLVESGEAEGLYDPYPKILDHAYRLIKQQKLAADAATASTDTDQGGDDMPF